MLYGALLHSKVSVCSARNRRTDRNSTRRKDGRFGSALPHRVGQPRLQAHQFLRACVPPQGASRDRADQDFEEARIDRRCLGLGHDDVSSFDVSKRRVQVTRRPASPVSAAWAPICRSVTSARARSTSSGASSSACFSDGSNGQTMASVDTRDPSGIS